MERKGMYKRDLDPYVKENLKRSEMLDCVKRDYLEHAWSIATQYIGVFDILDVVA